MAEVVLDPPMREIGTIFDDDVWLRNQYRDIVASYYPADYYLRRQPMTWRRQGCPNIVPRPEFSAPFESQMWWRDRYSDIETQIREDPWYRVFLREWPSTLLLEWPSTLLLDYDHDEAFLRAATRVERTWRIRTRPDKWRPTLSSWLKNMNKLDGLIDRLQEHAFTAPPEHRSQLFNKVAVLRATFERQLERIIEILKLNERYANEYLHDISAEIKQQSTVLDNLEERLETAKKLHGDAVDLQMYYESGTVAAMKDLRTTGIPRPLPEDNPLFSEVDFVLAEIRGFYGELKDFWTEEIHHVFEALRKGRTDPRDFERWSDFYSSLKQTIEFWKNRPPGGDAQPLLSENTSSQTGVDLGAIASSLSPTIGSLSETLERVSSCASLKYSQLGQSSFQRVYVAFARNSEVCLSFLWSCANYGEKVFAWCLYFLALSTSSRVGAPHDLQEQTTRLLSEAAGVSTENAAITQGPRRFKVAYNKALTLEQKTTSVFNALVENLSSWARVTDGPSDDALPDVVTLEQLKELKCAWEKARASVRADLATLTSEPAQRVASMQTGSRLRRWMKSLVFIS